MVNFTFLDNILLFILFLPLTATPNPSTANTFLLILHFLHKLFSNKQILLICVHLTGFSPYFHLMIFLPGFYFASLFSLFMQRYVKNSSFLMEYLIFATHLYLSPKQEVLWLPFCYFVGIFLHHYRYQGGLLQRGIV